MTIYERNMEVLKAVRKDIYEEVENAYNPGEQVLVGDALDGEKFLAVVREEEIFPLNSTYHPTHEAQRFVLQFEKQAEESIVLLFGFGSGTVVEQILSEECPVDVCIVYEPSIAVFRKALEEYDLSSVLSNPGLLLFVEGINGDQLEYYLVDLIDYSNWRCFNFKKLSQYQKLFPEQCKKIAEMYQRVYVNNRAAMNTLIAYAKIGLINEVNAMKWMMDCRTLSGMIGKFPKDLPAIVVAAGPSLEKNVDVLKQAKGKAFIICVDTAIPFMLKHNIIPDMVCTIDATKGIRHFAGPEIHNLPLAVYTDSNYKVLNYIGEVNPYYMSTTSNYYQELFRQKGNDVGYFDGGGSVGTVCFKLCLVIGFRTVILVGQDLAFTSSKMHAGKTELKNEELLYGIEMVEGYYGEKVMTRGDYKTYIDWYNLQIPNLVDRVVVNATEGGAKLKGAVQMPLQEAVDTYCQKPCDVSAILERVPKVWASEAEKSELYWEFKHKYQFYTGFRRRVKDGIMGAERAISLLKRKNYQPKELKEIDKRLNSVTRETEETLGMETLIKRMIKTHITLNDDLDDVEDDLEMESIRLYDKMKVYLGDLLEALDEMLPIWKDVLLEINKIYQFESEV